MSNVSYTFTYGISKSWSSFNVCALNGTCYTNAWVTYSDCKLVSNSGVCLYGYTEWTSW